MLEGIVNPGKKTGSKEDRRLFGLFPLRTGIKPILMGRPRGILAQLDAEVS